MEEFFGSEGESERTLRRGQWTPDDYQIVSKHLENSREFLAADDDYAGILKSDDNKIPHCIHFVWLGPNPLPRYPSLASEGNSSCSTRLWNETIQSWQEHHHDWEIKIWNERDVLKLSEEYQDLPIKILSDLMEIFRLSNQTNGYGMGSDIARLLILHALGGVYVDVDYYCIGSVEEFHDEFEFYCGASNAGCIEINNGLLGSIPKHSFILDLMEKISIWFSSSNKSAHLKGARTSDIKREMQMDDNFSMLSCFLDVKSLSSLQRATQAYTAIEVITQTGPGLLTRELLERLREKNARNNIMSSKARFVIFPYYVFNPLPNSQKKLGLEGNDCERSIHEIIQTYIRGKKTKAIHLWSCSWQT